ncbi:adenosylmethionine--8-amino-7-oxononanoate transaminase [Campylobacter corcagiensis]|uniref:Multifunctional fusion protein n=1 Tax=Campylobacter corcagiensis TaxID=1448857 RepID=A0A7M1LFP0_9BACT|nr:adenosylmethionine--8-amino-7-oxononanoate transaminase [Campylobacter corcagiensis]QKF64392.1 bifunctional 7,8-diaminopelargonic acid synthase / dethiobiotin synthetase [Campylobacter corcagiensis]QOQ87422.1 adenosylmethionine--8-amino-7-oxononanoate transaminase [Campylobacter corcagiensis]
MSLFITGTDTDVGKTFITASLLKAYLDLGKDAVAIKPVQSGCENSDALDTKVYKSVNPNNNFSPLYALNLATSPHLAAKADGVEIELEKCVNYCNEFLSNHKEVLVEGAGGLFVPLNDNQTMIDLIKRLDLPTVLVASNKLGAINHTILSLKTLKNYGIKTPLLVLNLSDEKSEISRSNIEYLRLNFKGEIVVINSGESIDSASKKLLNFVKNFKPNTQKIDLEFDKNHLFHPYTSSISPLKSYGVKSANGSYIEVEGKTLLDGMCSWWCAYGGYNIPSINSSIIKQINSLSHIMFGGFTHAPAINLGKKLLEILPKGMDKIFYCDSGSVSVEVALKMAIQYQQNKDPNKNKILTILGGYHGDTFGAMGVCDPTTGMHSMFGGILSKQIFAPKPKCKFGEIFDEKTLKPYEEIISKNSDKIAAIIVEPLVQGAGGMWFYHENYLKFLRKKCDEIGALLIFDEVATGFGRLGEYFASSVAGVTPDIMCIGKALTAGYMSFAATICTKDVADTICQNKRVFMHGPTFMANPLACSVALASIEYLQSINFKNRVKDIEKELKFELEKCKKLPEVVDVRVFGAIGVVEIDSEVNVEKIQEFFVENGVWIRPFGKNIYTMPQFNVTKDELKKLCDAIYESIKTRSYK